MNIDIKDIITFTTYLNSYKYKVLFVSLTNNLILY